MKLAFALVAWLAASAVIPGCSRSGGEPAGFPVADPSAECLPDMTLTDARGQQISLASLRGQPVLFDFIYTSCPGPCEALTAQMVLVAKQLARPPRTKAHIVSITVDPEHDGPEQLLAFAKAQSADLEEWSFLTGTPEQIDLLMARFSLARERSPDGSIEHVLEFFLVGPDGHPLRQYPASRADPAAVAGDVRRVSATGRVE